MLWKSVVGLDQEFLFGIFGFCSHLMISEVLPSVQGSILLLVSVIAWKSR